MKIVFRTMIAALAAFGAAACAGGAGKQPADAASQAVPQEEVIPNVKVMVAAKRDVPQEEVYSTSVQAYAVNNIVPQTGNRIVKINAEIGDVVRKGQILAEMDRTNLMQTRLKLVNDSTELVRLKGLYEEGGLSQSDYDAVVLAYNVSKTSYSNLLENTILRSPINGVVTARNYDVGDMYAMASPIFVVQQLTPVKLLIGISETDYSSVSKGDKVLVTADALPGRTFEGKVNRIYPVIDAVSHTFTVEVVVPNVDKALRPGMFARATVTFDVRSSIVLPDMAVVKLQGSGQRSVYVLNADGTVDSRIVTLGRHIGGEFEILSGVEEGETVIVKGQTALKDGTKVNVIE